jgi:hypothetical protein
MEMGLHIGFTLQMDTRDVDGPTLQMDMMDMGPPSRWRWAHPRDGPTLQMVTACPAAGDGPTLDMGLA